VGDQVRTAWIELQDAGEEFANTLSHGIGLIFAVALLPFALVVAAHRGDSIAIAGVAAFAVALVMVYASSTIYHALPKGEAKAMAQRVDHAAIYVMIAGTYTPFAVGALRGWFGWVLLTLVWAIAAFGVRTKLSLHIPLKCESVASYLWFGWLIVIATPALIHAIGWAGFAWLIAGGLSFTAGAYFCANDERIRNGHCLWHLFVLAGSTCHAVAVLVYAIPTPATA
jgi:hemolysin III